MRRRPHIYMYFHIKACAFLLFISTSLGSSLLFAADSDSDGIDDSVDNCTAVANPAQLDGDSDGHGNACDGDFDNSCVTNLADLVAFKAAFGTADTEMDLNSSGGNVNLGDLVVFASLFGQEPGPSAPGSLCNPDSDNDGVADADDLCPGTAPGVPVDSDGCALPVPSLLSATATARPPSRAIRTRRESRPRSISMRRHLSRLRPALASTTTCSNRLRSTVALP